MRVFRQKYHDRDGKVRESAKWYVEFRDHRETVRRVPGFADKGATRELGRKLERLAALRGAGDVPDGELLRWLETVPTDLRDRLVKFDLLDGRSNATGKLLSQHVAEFKANLAHRSRTASHVELIVSRVEATFAACRFRYPSDISASRVQAYLADLKQSGRSPQTCKHYLQAVKQFTRWLVSDRRAVDNPLAHLEPPQAAGDVRCRRRELSTDELAWLLSAAKAGPERFGLTGWQRYMLYSMAVGTGLRASELASLTPDSFDLQSTPRTVTIDAPHAKSRKSAVLPLPTDLCEILKPWLKGLERSQILWPGKWAAYKQAGKFIQLDLAAARADWLKASETSQERERRERTDVLLYRDSDGMQADFHALRHTYLSRLGRAGVPAKVMQTLARHSTVELTLGKYTHVNVYDLAAGVAALPPLPSDPKTTSDVQELRATGTDDRPTVLPSVLPETVAIRLASVQSGAVSTPRTRSRQKRSNLLETTENGDYDGAGAHSGEVAERSIAPVLKTGRPARVSRVRIPASPLVLPKTEDSAQANDKIQCRVESEKAGKQPLTAAIRCGLLNFSLF